MQDSSVQDRHHNEGQLRWKTEHLLCLGVLRSSWMLVQTLEGALKLCAGCTLLVSSVQLLFKKPSPDRAHLNIDRD
jgi:hypothetical protein